MHSFSSLFITTLLFAYARSTPLHKRDDDNRSIVQGLLGTDGYWNDFDGGTNAYVKYTGDGSEDAGWPIEASWVSFNEMWITNAHIIARSCDLHYKQANNNAQEMEDLYAAIKQVAHETRVDHRFILAAILQESSGCVRASTDTADDGEKVMGLLQDYKGPHTCNDGNSVQNPCPQDQILGMVRDGVAGGNDGHGFAEDVNEQASKVDSKKAWAYFRAARLYNSGSIDSSDDLEKASSGQKCYASDIANRLMGWTDAASTCDFDS